MNKILDTFIFAKETRFVNLEKNMELFRVISCKNIGLIGKLLTFDEIEEERYNWFRVQMFMLRFKIQIMLRYANRIN